MTTFVHALAGILPAWRPLRHQELPLWTFLGTRARVSRLQALQAERRCEACHLRPRCRRRIAAGNLAPARGCPNAELFH